LLRRKEGPSNALPFFPLHDPSIRMPLTTNESIRRLQAPTYFIVAFLGIGSAIEVLLALGPIRIHEVNWRLGMLNSAAAATGTELLALLILIVMGQLAMSSGALWAGFCCSVVAALGYLMAAGLFVLDSLQLRARVTAAALTQFDITIGWALARFAFAEIVCLWLAACALWAARALARQASPRETANKLVVGVPGAGAAPIPR
jgi:hypothetical protein